MARIIYPSDAPEITYSSEYDFPREVLKDNPGLYLQRQVLIQYSDLSEGRKYTFRGVWDWNEEFGRWEVYEVVGN